MVSEYEKGDTALFKGTWSDSTGTVVSPDQSDGDFKTFIEITDADTGTVMLNTRMDTISSTQFKKTWETTEGMSEGQYEVEIKASISGKNVLNRDNITLVDLK